MNWAPVIQVVRVARKSSRRKLFKKFIQSKTSYLCNHWVVSILVDSRKDNFLKQPAEKIVWFNYLIGGKKPGEKCLILDVSD